MKNGRTNAKRLTKGIAPPRARDNVGGWVKHQAVQWPPRFEVGQCHQHHVSKPTFTSPPRLHPSAELAFVRQAMHKRRKHTAVSHTLLQAHGIVERACPSQAKRIARPTLVFSDAIAGWNVRHRVVDHRLLKDPCGGALSGERVSHDFADVCLVDSLRALGADVPYSSSGPFRAIADGNQMLAPLGLFLTPVSFGQVGAGRYIRWKNHHFTALHIQRSTIWMTDGRFTTRVANLGAFG